MIKIIIVSIFCFLQSCGDPCSRDVVQSIASEDGAIKITALIKNCGATTPFVVEVYAHPAGEKFDKGVLAFRGEGEKIKIGWKGNGSIDIITDAKTVILMKEIWGIDFSLNGK